MKMIKLLEEWLKRHERVAVALSGGIDSTLLAYVASKTLDGDMMALTGDSGSVPERDRSFVVEFCEKHGIRHMFILTGEFSDAAYLENTENRCYFCKKSLFTKLGEFANGHGYKYVLDGTNYSDLSGHRPGYRAITEMNFVKTPYVEMKITKDDIRKMAEYLGLETAGKPASACLASRIPWGRRIERADLMMVDKAENILREIGMSQVRVRHHCDLARIQIVPSDTDLFFRNKKNIVKKLNAIGYKYVTIDLLYYGEHQ